MVGISEIDVDAIIAYGVIHLEGTYDNFTYPLKEEMQQWLLDRNIGYDFKKKKSTIKSLRLEKLKLVYKYSILLNNYGDISLINPSKLPDFDLFNFTFSCTDYSTAGKQQGKVDKQGNITRSGQYIYGVNIIKAKKPKYIMIENVKNLISKKFINDFYDIINELNNIGYNCYYPKNNKGKPICLNAKDYGIPQNRERIFVICIRQDINKKQYLFPNGFDNGVRLKDLLEDKIDEKYYISQDKTNKLLFELKAKEIGVNPCLTPDRINKRQNGRRFKEDREASFTINTQDRHGILINQDKVRFKDDNVSSCLDANYYKGLDNHAQRTGILESDAQLPILHNIYGGFNEKKPRLFFDYSPTIRTSAGGGHIPSVCTNDSTKVEKIIDQYRIRKFTPKECWRLMDFDDEDIDKCINIGISNTSLYKMAGNSIVVSVLYYIFKNLFNI